MGAWKMTLVSKGAIFHFHDYGRKGRIWFKGFSFLKDLNLAVIFFSPKDKKLVFFSPLRGYVEYPIQFKAT